jgi:hypothetical protein
MFYEVVNCLPREATCFRRGDTRSSVNAASGEIQRRSGPVIPRIRKRRGVRKNVFFTHGFKIRHQRDIVKGASRCGREARSVERGARGGGGLREVGVQVREDGRTICSPADARRMRTEEGGYGSGAGAEGWQKASRLGEGGEVKIHRHRGAEGEKAPREWRGGASGPGGGVRVGAGGGRGRGGDGEHRRSEREREEAKRSNESTGTGIL